MFYVLFVAGPSRHDILPDYVAFYAAADLAAQGRLAEAYDAAVSGAVQFALTGQGEVAPWFYPPSYSPLIAWLPWLPYYVGAVLFLALSFGLFVAALRPFLVDRTELWIVLGAPVCFVNAFHGQNGFLTGGLIALAVTLLPHRQVGAGLAMGVLSVKPHLGLLLPVAVIAWRRWRALAAAVAAAAALALMSLALYGPAPWVAFAGKALGSAGDHIAAGTLPISMNASAYAAFQLAGLPDGLAMALHLAVCIALVGATVRLVQTGVPYRLVVAFLLSATLLASPHNFVYDWTLVLIPMLILWREGRTGGFLRHEKAGLVAAYFAPFAIIFARHGGFPVATAAILVPLALAWRRARTASAT